MDTFYFLIGETTDPIAWWQMSIRAAIIFFYAVLLYRLAPKRSFANLAASDVVLTVIVGSSLSRALTGNAPLLAALAATAALVLLYAALSALALRSEWVSRLVKGRPVQLIYKGTLDRQKARRSNLGPHDVAEQLRMKGVKRAEDVEEAYLERNGAISVIKSANG